MCKIPDDRYIKPLPFDMTDFISDKADSQSFDNIHSILFQFMDSIDYIINHGTHEEARLLIDFQKDMYLTTDMLKYIGDLIRIREEKWKQENEVCGFRILELPDFDDYNY